MIELKNVSYDYDKKNKIIKELNKTIEQGQFICVIGKNGSRKINFCQANSRNYQTNDGGSFCRGKRYEKKGTFFGYS